MLQSRSLWNCKVLDHPAQHYRDVSDIIKSGGGFMKCPKCNTEMIKGTLQGGGNYWKEKNTFAEKITGLLKMDYVFAYRCPSCGKLDLTTEVKKQN